MAIVELEPTTFVCAWCDRMYVDDAWRVVDHAARAGRDRITHGICEDCAGEMMPVTPRAARRFCTPG